MKKRYILYSVLGILIIGIVLGYIQREQKSVKDFIIPNSINITKNDTECKKQTSQEYSKNKSCLEEIKIQSLTGVEIYNAIDQCFSYRDNIDYSSKNKCYETYQRNDVLYSICVEATRKDNIFDNLGDPLVMLKFRIKMEECMSKMVFRNEKFIDLSAEFGEKSSFKKCSNISQCGDQELCNVNQSGRCEKSDKHLYSIKEIEPIIKDNKFTDQGCAHSGVCSITSTKGEGYLYKSTISIEVNEILKKYSKTIENQRIE